MNNYPFRKRYESTSVGRVIGTVGMEK